MTDTTIKVETINTDTLSSMKKYELQHKCEKMGLKNFGNKKKDDLIELIICKEKEFKAMTKEQRNFNLVIYQLVDNNPKDTHRTVCKRCHMVGHTQKSKKCPEYVSKKEQYRADIKAKILSHDVFDSEYNTMFEYLDSISKELGIGKEHCRQIYNEMSNIELLTRPTSHEMYQNYIATQQITCSECDDVMYISGEAEVKEHTWQGGIYCLSCITSEKNEYYTKLEDYKPSQCVQCEIQKEPESLDKFHYRYTNIFDDKNIDTLIKEGADVEDIKNELDNCDVYCHNCYNQIDDIYKLLNIDSIVKELKKDLDDKEIDDDEYNTKSKTIQRIFQEKLDYLL